MSNEKLTDEHIARLETALANIENDYRPTCESAGYGSGCPGPTDASLDFWRRAVDCLPALIAELRAHRSRDLSETNRLALSYALDLVRDHGCKCGACRATTAERVLTRLVEQKL